MNWSSHRFCSPDYIRGQKLKAEKPSAAVTGVDGGGGDENQDANCSLQ